MNTKPAAQNPFVNAIPWYVWISVLAVSCAVIGTQWDIAWHRSIGRDTFWSPPHMLAGLACGYMILSTTFGSASPARAAAVRIWGFSGPLGAFIAAWGGIAMLASAPFDDWWHNAYGIDVKILSPPHTVLALGLVAIQIGALILIAGMMNGARGRIRTALRGLFLYVGGFILVSVMTFEMEYTGRVFQHTGTFYRVVCCAAPLILLGVGRASGHRWGATVTAAVYSALLLLLLWLFPLVPATPKLGPVYHQVTHLIPAGFPLLLIVPALLMDLLTPYLEQRIRSPWLLALFLGALFLGVFLCVQWPFARFLQSSIAQTWVFGSHYIGFNTRRSAADMRFLFIDRDGGAQAFAVQLMLAFVAAVITSRLGIYWSSFMSQIRR